MRGATATLSCHFKVESLRHGFQWFKMSSEKQQRMPESPRQSVVEKNQTSSLVITEVALGDSGWYYCEVNVLQKEPERGNGTELVVLGERQIARYRNSCSGDFVEPVIMSHLYLLCGGGSVRLGDANIRVGPCITIKKKGPEINP